MAPPRDASTDGPREDRPEEGVELPCTRPVADRPAGSVCVREVRGRVVDERDAPRVDIPVTVCGPVCWLGRTDAEGRFAVTVGDFIPLAIYSVLAHGRPDHATVYVPLPAEVGSGDVVTLGDAIRVPRYTVNGGSFDGDAGVVRAGEIQVRVPPGARVELDLEDYKLGALGRMLRVAEVAPDRAPPFAREGRAQAVWALAPFNLQSSVGFGIRVPNTLGLAPGARVEFFAMGWELLPPRANAGRAVDVATGAVTPDGAAIESDPDAGVPALTWIAVRARSN